MKGGVASKEQCCEEGYLVGNWGPSLLEPCTCMKHTSELSHAAVRKQDLCSPIPVLHWLKILLGMLISWYCGLFHTKAEHASVARESPEAEGDSGKPGSIWELCTTAAADLWTARRGYGWSIRGGFPRRIGI